MIGENPELNTETFTFDAFLKYRKSQVSAFALELRYVAALIAAVTLILNATNWDDDEENNILTRYLYRLAVRTKLEMTFWFDPQSVTDIIKSPIPAWRLVTDFQQALTNFWGETAEAVGLVPENNRDQTPYLYYTFKKMPFGNQVGSLVGFFPTHKGESSTVTKILEASRIFEEVPGYKK